MGSGMPEIGSRISLISKADIRYEGKLFSVDPEECTIALSSVRSYGTEDREAPFPVPAQNNVYDYILFRGTDIKDIRVLSTTIPNDPAIVQLSVPPSLHDSQFQSRSGYSHQPMAGMSLPNAPGTSRDQSQSFPGPFAGMVNARTSAADLISKSQSSQNVPSEDDSRSSTPSTHHAKSNDANARVSVSSNAEDSTQTSKRTNNNYNNRDRPQSGNRYQQAPRQQYQQRYQPQSRYQNQQSQQQQQSQPRYMQQQQQPSHYRDYNRDNQYRNYNEYRDSYGSRQYMQNARNQQRGDGWSNYDQRNGRNRMGQNGQQRINYQSTGYQNQNRKPKSTLKFEDDFDFDKANSEFEPVFEQLRSQLEKTKLNDGPADSPTIKMNGDVDSKKEDGVTIDVGSGGEENDAGSEEKPQFYDKVKSFFDQISYESIERSKGLTTRVDWKTERKINSETFGQTALRRNNYYGRVGQNGGNYYNHQNRNMNMANNYNRNRYNRPQQQQQLQQPRPMNNQRRPFNSTNKTQETVEAKSS